MVTEGLGPASAREVRLVQWGPPLALALALALSLLMRLPALTWPLNQQPDVPCCGHPDEIKHYDIFRRLPAPTQYSIYPPGLGVMIYLATGAGLGRVAHALVPTGTREEERARVRGVYTARLLSLLFSVVGVWLVYVVGRQAGLSRWLAACGGAFLAFSPLFAVHSLYGLADVPNAVLVLAYVACFLRWSERQDARLLLAFALLLGAALVVKLGVTVGLPLALQALLTARRRAVAVALLLAGLAVGAYLTSGASLTVAQVRAGSKLVYYDNLTAAQTSVPWNAVHHLGSLIPGMGALFSLVFLAGVGGWLGWARRIGPAGWRGLLANPWGALAAGCALSFAVICQASSTFTRHMLVLYPFLVVFALAGVAHLGPVRRVLEARGERPGGRTDLIGAAIVALVTAYGAVAAWPVLGSFSDDPTIRAARWLHEQSDDDDRLAFSPYAERATYWLSARRGRPGDGRPRELTAIHSHWVGRLTGRGWLKPAPDTPEEVKDFEGRPGDLRYWQTVMGGRSEDWRIVAAFGEEWWTVERAFLRAVGRGYDRFVTTGQVLIAERTGERS